MKFYSLLLFICLFAIDLSAMLVTLQDGTVLHGEIVDYSEEGIILRSFDTNGEIEVSWKLVHSKDRKRIKTKLGLVRPKKKAQKIAGVVVYLRTGGAVEGKIAKKSSDKVIIKTNSGNLPIPRDNIIRIDKQIIDLTSIYTEDELYKQGQKKYNLQTAEGQWQLAEFMAEIGAYEKADKHLKQAQELSSTDDDPKWQSLTREIAKALQEGHSQKLLQRYYAYVRGHKYKSATDILEELKTKLSEKEIAKYQENLEKSQAKYFIQIIPSLWLKGIATKIISLSTDSKKTLQETQSTLEEYEQEIIADLAQKFAISESAIRDYFSKRNLDIVRRYSYGKGTFIAGLTGKNSDLVEDLKKWQEIQQKVRKNSRRVSGEQMSTDEWWKKARPSEKREWLNAYYLENRLKVVKQTLKPCPQCQVKGVIRKSGKLFVCTICQGVGFFRTVIAK